MKNFREDTLERGQRYIGLHQYFFFVSFLYPRAFTTSKECNMTNEVYEKLKEDGIDQMIAKSKAMSKKKKSSDQCQEKPPATTSLPYSTNEKSKKHSKASQMLRDLNAKPKESIYDTADNDDELCDDFMEQLNRCIKDALGGGLSLSKKMMNCTVIHWSGGRIMWSSVN